MGVLTDLLIATEAELASVPEHDVPINVLPGLDIKGTGLVELATLYAIVTGGDFDAGMDNFPAVSGQDSEEGPWVFRFPDLLLERLSAASQTDISRYADQWAETEEIQAGGWSAQEVEEQLREMRAFATQAIEAKKPMYIWTSL